MLHEIWQAEARTRAQFVDGNKTLTSLEQFKLQGLWMFNRNYGDL